jgi:hypothetical protein
VEGEPMTTEDQSAPEAAATREVLIREGQWKANQ